MQIQISWLKNQLIWIYTVCKGRVYPGSAGQELILVFSCQVTIYLQAAERALLTKCGAVNATFVGNAPCGYQSYKLPSNFTEAYGVKVC